jgi:hypothetical protein
VQCSAVQCSAVQCSAVQCSAVCLDHGDLRLASIKTDSQQAAVFSATIGRDAFIGYNDKAKEVAWPL